MAQRLPKRRMAGMVALGVRVEAERERERRGRMSTKSTFPSIEEMFLFLFFYTTLLV
jgi:hypothetical protein